MLLFTNIFRVYTVPLTLKICVRYSQLLLTKFQQGCIKGGGWHFPSLVQIPPPLKCYITQNNNTADPLITWNLIKTTCENEKKTVHDIYIQTGEMHLHITFPTTSNCPRSSECIHITLISNTYGMVHTDKCLLQPFFSISLGSLVVNPETFSPHSRNLKLMKECTWHALSDILNHVPSHAFLINYMNIAKRFK